MKDVFLTAMNELFDLSTMLARIDYHHVRGNLTDDEREELIAIAREKAYPFGGVDVTAKLLELDERIAALEKSAAGSEGADDAGIADYVPGKWYYAGDRVMENGTAYECIAPEGVVCTWSPTEYPEYWKAI